MIEQNTITGTKVTNIQYCRQHNNDFTFDHQSGRSEQAATTADDLAHIKSILKLTVSELADCIGVSRQAIYNWKAGADINTIT